MPTGGPVDRLDQLSAILPAGDAPRSGCAVRALLSALLYRGKTNRTTARARVRVRACVRVCVPVCVCVCVCVCVHDHRQIQMR